MDRKLHGAMCYVSMDERGGTDGVGFRVQRTHGCYSCCGCGTMATWRSLSKCEKGSRQVGGNVRLQHVSLSASRVHMFADIVAALQKVDACEESA